MRCVDRVPSPPTLSRPVMTLLGALVLTLTLGSAGESLSLGALTQLAGTDGCISEDGTGGACADGTALDGATFVAVSRDGKNVYVSSFLSNAVAAFDRD